MSSGTSGSKGVKVIGVSIGIVADRIGIHPQTLREYERKGLVTPQRTPGGSRRYSEDELERLRRIQQLTEQGLSLQAVSYVLDLEDRIREQSRRIEELEQRLGRYEPGTRRTQGRGGEVPVVRSMSLELIPVPRRPRGPRWSNRDS